MRQSQKETSIEWLMREGFLPERREALTAAADIRNEFSDELGSMRSTGAAKGRRHPPVGRG